MLETIREYAAERLGEDPEAQRLRERHSQWFLALAEDAGDRLYTDDQGELFARLDEEHDKRPRRARLVRWSRDGGTGASAGRRTRGLLDRAWTRTEGRARTEAALTRGGEVSGAVRAKALDGAAWLATAQRDYAAVEQFAAESLALSRALNDPRRIVSALGTLGAAEVQQGRYRVRGHSTTRHWPLPGPRTTSCGSPSSWDSSAISR